MISSVLTMKLLEYVILIFVRQVARIRIRRVSKEAFFTFAIGRLGIMFMIHYIRKSGSGLTK